MEWIIAPLAVGLLGGCAHLDRSAMSYMRDMSSGKTGQRVFIWKSNYLAGIGTNGGVCAQGALTAKAKSSNTMANFSAEIFNAFAKLPNLGSRLT